MTTEPQAPAAPSEPVAEAPAPAPAPNPAFMTEAQAIAELNDFIKRAEASNLSPMALLARVGWRRGVGMLDGLLSTVEESLSAEKRKV